MGRQAISLFLVRHAESVPSAGVADQDWPLSAAGQVQARRLVDVLRRLKINAVAASPYLRAVETIRPFAEASNLPVIIEPDIRERRLSVSWIEDFEAVQNLIHGDPHGSLPGGESAFEARLRFERGLDGIARRFPRRRVAVATHGSVIAHLLRHHHPHLPDDYHRRIRNPHIFELKWGEPTLWLSETTLDGVAGVGWAKGSC